MIQSVFHIVFQCYINMLAGIITATGYFHFSVPNGIADFVQAQWRSLKAAIFNLFQLRN